MVDSQILNPKHLSAIERLTETYPWLSASEGVHITYVYIRL